MFYTLKGKCGKARVMLLPMQGGCYRITNNDLAICNSIAPLKVCAMRQEGLSEE
jgi:hypothetical protein